MTEILVVCLKQSPKALVKGLRYLDIRGHVYVIQIAAFLRSARILRIVQASGGDLPSLKLKNNRDYNLLVIIWFQVTYNRSNT